MKKHNQLLLLALVFGLAMPIALEAAKRGVPAIDLVSSSDSGSDDDSEPGKRRRRGAVAVDEAGPSGVVATSSVPVADSLAVKEQFMGYVAGGNVAGMNSILSSKLLTNFNFELYGSTPLMVAAANGKEESVNFLLNLCVQQNLHDSQGKTALMLAIERRHVEVVKQLTARRHKVTWHTDLTGKSLLDYATESGDDDIKAAVESLYLEVPVVAAPAPVMNRTAFFAAAVSENIAVLDTLFNAGDMVDVNCFDGFHCTPLMHAASAGKLNSVQWLLAHSANVGMRHTEDGRTALMFAVEKGHVVVVDLLMRISDIASKDFSGKTAEDHAPAGSVIRKMLVDYKNTECPQLFINAAQTGNFTAVSNLLDTVDINHLDPATQKTALMLAIEHGHEGLAELLIAFGASKDVVCPADGNTALHYAIEREQITVVKTLLKPFGMISQAADITIENNARRNALAVATSYGNAAIIQAVRDAEEMVLTCGICMDKITPDSKDIISCKKGAIDCKAKNWLEKEMRDRTQHLYCKQCLQQWRAIKSTCPLHNAALNASCLEALGVIVVPPLAVPAHAVLHHGGLGIWAGTVLPGATTQLIAAVASNNAVMVRNLLAAGADVNEIDPSGRAALGVYLSNLHHGGGFGGGIDIGILVALLDASVDVITPIPALAHYYDPLITNMSGHAWVNAVNYHTQTSRHLINLRYARQLAGLPGFRN